MNRGPDPERIRIVRETGLARRAGRAFAPETRPVSPGALNAEDRQRTLAHAVASDAPGGRGVRAAMSDDANPLGASRAEQLQARLTQNIDDLMAGRISVAGANAVTREIAAELRVVEAMVRTVKAVEPLPRE